MSAISASVQRERLRPLPWRRMAWITWRQHRFALAGVAVLLDGLALYLWIIGRQLHHAYAAAISCHPAGSAACVDAVVNFNGLNRFLLGGYVVQPVPALIGAFVGAPVVAREFETGTFRYAWTQGFGRWRWALAKLAGLALALVAAAGLVSVLFSWYYRPYFGAGNGVLSLRAWSPLDAYLFDLRGTAFAAWTVVAFAIGGLVGALIRRVVPAIAATLVAYAGLALAAGMVLRKHYLAPLSSSRPNLPASDWIVGSWWTKAGMPSVGPWNNPHLCPPTGAGKTNASFLSSTIRCTLAYIPGRNRPSLFFRSISVRRVRELGSSAIAVRATRP